jgi:hypothetical protein
MPWETPLSKLEGVGYPTLREWAGPWEKATHRQTLGDHLSIGGYLGGFFYDAWWPSFTYPTVRDGTDIQNNWKVMMIKATPEKFVRLGSGSFDPGMIPWTPMALAGGKLIVRRETGISCYDLRAK